MSGRTTDAVKILEDLYASTPEQKARVALYRMWADAKVTKKQEQMLDVIEEYAGIADTGNVMAETGWPKRSVASVGGSLVRKGLVTFSGVTGGGTAGMEGGVWKLVRPKTTKRSRRKSK